MKKKNTILLVSAISLLIVTIIGATYAYFTSVNPENINALNIGANIASANSAFTAVGNNIELNITADNMQQANQNNVVATDSKNLTVSYLAGTTQKLECKYDIYYKWQDGTDAYSPTFSVANEFTFEVSNVRKETNFVASSNTNPQKVNGIKLKISNASETVPTVKEYTITSRFYNLSGDQTALANKNWKIEFYVDNVVCGEGTDNGLVDTLAALIESGDDHGTNSDGDWEIVNQDVTINNENVINTIYTGANPNNFVEFNGEMWRIIGVYNEDTHGKSGEQLVKLVRNDNLIVSTTDGTNAKARWDRKTLNGTNEWSNSQLMFMLNGESAINKGKLYNGNAYTYSLTRANNGNIEISDNESAYYTMWKYSNGSYLSYDANGDSITNKEIYTSSYVDSTHAYDDSTAVLAKTLSSASQDLIEEINWHIGSAPQYQSFSVGRANNFYNYERGNLAYSGTDNSPSETSTVRSTSWTGKIGLIYPSDFGYATSGGYSPRFVCIDNYPLSSWNSIPPCSQFNWLSYVGATASSKGTMDAQTTMTPYANYWYSIFRINGSYGSVRVSESNAMESNNIRPAIFLKKDVTVLDNGADGSYNNPYVIDYN